jgi:hypothetical protein
VAAHGEALEADAAQRVAAVEVLRGQKEHELASAMVAMRAAKDEWHRAEMEAAAEERAAKVRDTPTALTPLQYCNTH